MPLNAKAVYGKADAEMAPFASRRSTVHSRNGIVSCTQPLAAVAGQRILSQGGNAADAAVAVAAAMNMTEPCSTGIGGDMFCLFYNSKTKKVHALNGSGRYPGAASLEQVRKDLKIAPGEQGSVPMLSALASTTPGAAAGWVDTVEKFGSGNLSMEQILQPAIELGEEGFPVSEISSHGWHAAEIDIRNASPNFREMLKKDPSAKDGVRSPRPGEIMKNPTLAKTFRTLAAEGKNGFYQGRIAQEIVKVINDLGGYMTIEDLAYHAEVGTQEVDAISLKFTGQDIASKQGAGTDGPNQGVEVWEHPPNGQGIVALMALGIMEELEKSGKIPRFGEAQHNSAEYLHAVIESLRIAFADAAWWVTDPDVEQVPSQGLLAREYLAERAKLFDPERAADLLDRGSPAHNHCDTVYFAVTDREGNGISFINSNYAGFGTAIIPAGCGFSLQNRGANFSLQPDHPNALAPRKRPYHTIIPALITNVADGSLHSVYGVMGGFMQPQGHVQVLLNMLAFGYHPQAALDSPRICIAAPTSESTDRTICVEEGISEEAVEGLRRMGHQIEVLTGWKRSMFGRGQVIRLHYDEGQQVYSAGSDPRGDGMAFPML
ncbi:Gamma-glutamyltranspeptidase [Penicillium atrosanguineum]|uniref:Gamma-glutamyltranspeptidase n=1 Tax=Penicillium atrosanguineum TaxID=1132637 RepID=A0A9W9H135_9EURO|nr:acetolactate synthase mitochondrial [Penicillium atrosanguineum]KAJ5133046.1 Gamma-glutamyltranspeptidase [Penicillium atrosanguineum]KAJ5141061.1 Gamma-glutamyltranspeptidase [Penicillium atrosanguineum]KAJ5290715.1 acetolactate synthase mitochondrial [Penicillium atrosanguineum]KAJ5308537.1 Gamma-glutamyltranspeptidase [Penicillium atrosanguineum]